MDEPDKPRRDFLYVVTGAFAAIGAVVLTKPLLRHMTPAPDSVADAGLEIDLSKLNEGEQMTVSFLGPINMDIPPYKWATDTVIKLAYLNPS